MIRVYDSQIRKGFNIITESFNKTAVSRPREKQEGTCLFVVKIWYVRQRFAGCLSAGSVFCFPVVGFLLLQLDQRSVSVGLSAFFVEHSLDGAVLRSLYGVLHLHCEHDH